MKKTLPIILIFTIIVLTSYSLFTQKTDNTTTSINTDTIKQAENNQESTQENNPEQTEFPGKYVLYSPTIVQESANQGKRIVLFFHADWCPTCKVSQKDIIKRINEIPEDLIIVKTDYDTEKELKKKYSITYQHTYVQVNGDGDLITIWNGGDLDEILRNIK